jgi:membrane protein YdbS with pleckstrin-like domain
MPGVGFSGRLLNEGEYVVLTSRSHGKTLTGPVLVLLLTAFLGTFAAVRVGRQLTGPPRAAAVGAVLFLAVLVVARKVLVPFLRWLTTTYTFTNRRVVARSGVLTREGRTVPLDRVAGLDVEMGLLDRVLGCGTLVISDAGEDGRIELDDIPRVEEVQTRVADEVHRLRHGQHPEQEHGLAPMQYVGEDGAGGLRLDDRA